MTKRSSLQICGAKPEQIAKVCELINEEIDVDFVDLNMGCPIDLVTRVVSGARYLSITSYLMTAWNRVLAPRFLKRRVKWPRSFEECDKY